MAGMFEQGGEARKSVECLAAQDMPSHYAKTGSVSLKTLAPITTLSCLMYEVRAHTLGLCSTTATPCIEPHLISLNNAVVGASIQYSEWLGKGRKILNSRLLSIIASTEGPTQQNEGVLYNMRHTKRA